MLKIKIKEINVKFDHECVGRALTLYGWIQIHTYMFGGRKKGGYIPILFGS